MLLCIFFQQACLPLAAQKKIQLASPDGNIVFSVRSIDKTVMYNVMFKGKTVVDYSPLSLQFDDGSFKNSLAFNKPVYADSTEDYELVVGKAKRVHSEYKQAISSVEQKISSF